MILFYANIYCGTMDKTLISIVKFSGGS